MERQYAFNPQTTDQLGAMLQGAIWEHPGNTTLENYANTLQWGAEVSIINSSIIERPHIAKWPIMKFVFEYLQTI